jgi:hypothetical protein
MPKPLKKPIISPFLVIEKYVATGGTLIRDIIIRQQKNFTNENGQAHACREFYRRCWTDRLPPGARRGQVGADCGAGHDLRWGPISEGRSVPIAKLKVLKSARRREHPCKKEDRSGVNHDEGPIAAKAHAHGKVVHL